jgi:hypothetical protein
MNDAMYPSGIIDCIGPGPPGATRTFESIFKLEYRLSHIYSAHRLGLIFQPTRYLYDGLSFIWVPCLHNPSTLIGFHANLWAFVDLPDTYKSASNRNKTNARGPQGDPSCPRLSLSPLAEESRHLQIHSVPRPASSLSVSNTLIIKARHAHLKAHLYPHPCRINHGTFPLPGAST